MNTARRGLVNTLILIGMTLFNSCSKKMISTGDLPQKQICIGSYGGYTGMNRKNIILKNGLVFVSETMPGGKEIIRFEKKISKKKAGEMYKIINKIDFKTLNNSEPCNMTNYIERKRWIRKDRSYSWCGDLDTAQRTLNQIKTLLNLNYTY